MANPIVTIGICLASTVAIGFALQAAPSVSLPAPTQMILVDKDGHYKASNLGADDAAAEAEKAAQLLQSPQNLLGPFALAATEGQAASQYYLPKPVTPASPLQPKNFVYGFLISGLFTGAGYFLLSRKDEEIRRLQSNQWAGASSSSGEPPGLATPESMTREMEMKHEVASLKDQLEKALRQVDIRGKKVAQATSMLSESRAELQTVTSEFEGFKSRSESEQQEIQSQLLKQASELAEKDQEVTQLMSRLTDARGAISQALEERDQKSKDTLQSLNELTDMRTQNARLGQEIQVQKDQIERLESEVRRTSTTLTQTQKELDEIRNVSENQEMLELRDRLTRQLSAREQEVDMLERKVQTLESELTSFRESGNAEDGAQAHQNWMQDELALSQQSLQNLDKQLREQQELNAKLQQELSSFKDQLGKQEAGMGDAEAIAEQMQLARLEIADMNTRIVQSANQIQSLNRAIRDKEIDLESAREEIYRLRPLEDKMQQERSSFARETEMLRQTIQDLESKLKRLEKV